MTNEQEPTEAKTEDKAEPVPVEDDSSGTDSVQSKQASTPEGNQPITLPLEEADRLLLEAKQSRLDLARQKVISKVEMLFELRKQKALETELAKDPNVQALERTLDIATNKVLDNVDKLLPEGYAVGELTWEKGTFTAIHAPGQRGARREVK